MKEKFRNGRFSECLSNCTALLSADIIFYETPTMLTIVLELVSFPRRQTEKDVIEL